MLCDICKHDVTRLTYKWDSPLGRCRDCLGSSPSLAPGVITDSIPGGLDIKHGLCNDDGTPRKFYSKSEIKRAAFESGWTIGGETPKPNPRLQDLRAARG